VLNSARLTGTSWMSLLCANSRVWVASREAAVEKSRSSRLRKSLRVWGALEVVEVRRRMLWRRIWAVKLVLISDC